MASSNGFSDAGPCSGDPYLQGENQNMNLDARKTALALSLGMALAACGGSQDVAPGRTPDPLGRKATPAETGNSVVTKAPDDSSPIRKTEDGITQIRGDVLIQALLSQVGQRDADNQPYIDWLDAEDSSSGMVGDASTTTPLVGPVALVTRDIQSATPDETALGKYIFKATLDQGPLHASPDDYATKTRKTHPLDTFDIRFGLSQAGLPKAGNGAATAGTPLEIGRQLNLEFTRADDDFDSAPKKPLTMTLESTAVTTVEPNAYYTLYGGGNVWKHEWRAHVDRSREFASITLEISRPSDTNNQFDLCLDVSRTYANHQDLCERWEVPTDWRAGQPLKRHGQTLRESFFSELGSSITHWNWSDRKAHPPVAPDSLKTASQAIDGNGISGALLAALFDSFTPRAQGMKSLPARATRTAGGVLGTTPLADDPRYLSIYHESRATTYADGAAADTGSYAPATGSYLYALRSGTWQAPNQSRVPARGGDQITLALHVANDPQKGFTLPRWTGLNQLSIGLDGKQYWLYQGEQVGEGNAGKTIAPNDLILFGSTVQSWHDPRAFSAEKTDDALVRLTIEQATTDARSVDLCWYSNTGGLSYSRKSCTTWVVPEGWQPGQQLKPQAYHVVGRVGGQHAYWNTRVAGN